MPYCLHGTKDDKVRRNEKSPLEKSIKTSESAGAKRASRDAVAALTPRGQLVHAQIPLMFGSPRRSGCLQKLTSIITATYNI